jgi:N12 class adenine-specific DNA methylase
VGIDAGEVPSPAARAVDKNAANYRIADADRLGEGTAKEKFAQNVAAIRLLRSLHEFGRTASTEDKKILVRYCGWGGLPQAFAPEDEAPKWKKEQDELRALLTPEEYAAARATVLNAHYTPPLVIRTMYAGLQRLGFHHGRILEPACGTGHFFGLMPPEMARHSQLTGIEIDPITARIAQHLYPGADIKAEPFENAVLPANGFDVAISNVPFGDYAPVDPKLNPRRFKIHDYYFVAAAAKVRPGGLIVFVTSRGTLDKQYPHVREAIAKSCDLVAAFRLPHTTFKDFAGTEVTTDLIFLRKRLPHEKPSGPDWLKSEPMKFTENDPIFLNEYYHTRYPNLLGRMERVERGLYGRPEVRLTDDGRNLAMMLEMKVESLPQGIYQPLSKAETATIRQTIPAPPGVKPNAYVLTELGGGGIAVRTGDELQLLANLPAGTARRIRRLIRVRDAARECLRTQVENHPDDQVEAARFRLNQDYDYFVGQFGPISHSSNVRAFSGDPDLPLLLSLENYDEATNTAAKTAIFRERTIHPRTAVVSAGSAKEALVITLSEKGRVDLLHIAKLLGKPDAEFLPELQGALFLEPRNKRWQTDDEYLSGDVREKLKIAEEASDSDLRYEANVTALRAVQPTDLTASEIDARLGSSWIPEDDVAEFVSHLLRVPPRSREVIIHHAPSVGLWTVEASHYAKTGVANRSEWGTARIGAHELIEAALNLRTPTIYDYDQNKIPHVNPTATEAAREKQQKIKDAFAEWIWQGEERRGRLIALYNRKFNSLRLRTFSGEHLQLPGANPAITLRPHQKAAIWRILQSPNTLLAHVVGAGKTYTMAAAAMELKRLGLARKPMFVVPNHMLAQFSTELLNLYPGANILAPGRDDFAGIARRETMSRIATNNWDAIIVTHSGFERLPLSAAAKENFLQQQLEELETCIHEHKEKSGRRSSGARIVKELERAKKKLEAKLKTLAAEHRKDDTLTFEELGVDRLFVDEAQAYKNLFYISKMTRVAGLPQTASERAFDMLLKVRHVQKLNHGGGVVFATGTPVTNTMAEMFTMQRYLQPEVLRQHELQHFDAWAGTFGETVTAMELAPDGAGYRLHTRFARFVNVPELMQLFRQMADVQTADMLKLPIPTLDGGKPKVIGAPTSPELKQFVASLAKRAEKLKTEKIDPSIDNMLKITGEGRKAALDLRLVQPKAADFADGKVNQAVREIHRIWQGTQTERLTQMVFCDLSTPQPGGKGFSVYHDIKQKLIARGVPESEIAFIQDHDSDAAKLSLFKDVRSGKVRILFGSTQKMGAGTNAQTKLVALHHLDAPWRPADIQQREGRILRQGNENKSVHIFRYVTEGSFDAYMWQTLETKAKFIAQVITGQSSARKIEDLDAPALTYAEVKAIASGNPLVIEKAKVDSEVMRLSRLRAEHTESQFSARTRQRMAEEDLLRLERQLTAIEKDLSVRHDTHGDKFTIEVDGKTYRDRIEAGNALVYLVASLRDGRGRESVTPTVVGKLAGFKLEYRATRPDNVTVRGHFEYTANVSVSPAGFISSLEHVCRSIEDHVIRTRDELARSRQTATELGELIGRTFEHEEKYRELVARQSQLVDELDIAKNQAAAQQAAEATQIAEIPSAGVAPTPATTKATQSISAFPDVRKKRSARMKPAPDASHPSIRIAV